MREYEHGTVDGELPNRRRAGKAGRRIARSRLWRVTAVGGLAAGIAASVASSVAFAASAKSSPTSPTSGGGFQVWGEPPWFGGGIQGSGLGGNSGNSGSTGSEATGAPSNTTAIAASVSKDLVDINTTVSEGSAAGTGIVLTSNGEVLTNNHVIEGATSISVTDVGNGKTYGATVLGYDQTDDVALLQLTNASGLATASIGNSSSVHVGESVVGIGNAGGVGGTPSYAGGEVTVTGKTITAGDESSPTDEETLSGLIGTNAAIEPGDSGGPLVNASGQVLGIDTAGDSSEGGFGFTSSGSSSTDGYAIPINRAMSIANQILAGKSTSTIHLGKTGFLGVQITTASSATSVAGTNGSYPGYYGGDFGGEFYGGSYGEPTYGNSGTTTKFTPGALIVEVVSGSPASNAGLASNDTITALDGHKVTSVAQVSSILVQLKYNAKISVNYVTASGSSAKANVTLVSGPPQ